VGAYFLRRFPCAVDASTASITFLVEALRFNNLLLLLTFRKLPKLGLSRSPSSFYTCLDSSSTLIEGRGLSRAIPNTASSPILNTLTLLTVLSTSSLSDSI